MGGMKRAIAVAAVVVVVVVVVVLLPVHQRPSPLHQCLSIPYRPPGST